MAADVAEFASAIDKVYKTFSTQEVALDKKEMKGLSARGTEQFIEQKFQQQLSRARKAFLQEFRNHSVVVESETQKIRKELTTSLELKYGEQIASLKLQAEQADKALTKSREENQHLKRHISLLQWHRRSLERRELLQQKINSVAGELEESKRENSDLYNQLKSRDESVAQLQRRISQLEDELQRQQGAFAEEKRGYDERFRGLQEEMRQQQDQFKDHLRSYEERFEEYRAKTASELQILEILNVRRSDALASMEEERQRHIQARTKPTRRIGNGEESEDPELESRLVPYEMVKESRYRVDDMGMDTSWRNYQIAPARKPPKAKIKGAAGKAAGTLPPRETPRQLDSVDTPRQLQGVSVLAIAPQRRNV